MAIMEQSLKPGDNHIHEDGRGGGNPAPFAVPRCLLSSVSYLAKVQIQRLRKDL
jgi:hypothetical protein